MAFNTDGLVLSEGYADTMSGEVMPMLAARRREIAVTGDGDRPLYAARYDADGPRGTVLLVHGFTENADKPFELIHSLLHTHFSVVAYDQRGHGRSWRAEGLDDPSLTHVDAFSEYVRDMDCVYRQIVADMPKPHRVFCHSMGGAVTALYLEGHPGVFDRAAMCAPMIAPCLNGIPKSAARLMCQSQIAIGRAKKRIFGSKPYSVPENFDTACASGRARFNWYEALRAANPAFQNNGPSFGWLLEAIDVTDAILAPGAPEAIDAAIRLYTAALDETVQTEPQKAFIERVRRGQRVTVEGTKHEIYRSGDAVLFAWWHDVLLFLSNQ